MKNMSKKYYVIEKKISPLTATVFCCSFEDFCVVEDEKIAKDFCDKHSKYYSYREEEICEPDERFNNPVEPIPNKVYTYLTWKDLDFEEDCKQLRVRLNNEEYELNYYLDWSKCPVVTLFKRSLFGNIQISGEEIFNSLKLELVENN